jgi:hypothetical protein
MAKVILTTGGFRPSGHIPVSVDASDVAMKSQGEIEAVICEGISPSSPAEAGLQGILSYLIPA